MRFEDVSFSYQAAAAQGARLAEVKRWRSRTMPSLAAERDGTRMAPERPAEPPCASRRGGRGRPPRASGANGDGAPLASAAPTEEARP